MALDGETIAHGEGAARAGGPRRAAAAPPREDAAVVRQVHALVRDLMPHRPAIYWADFAVSWSVSMVAVGATLLGSGWVSAAGIVIAALGLYRVSVFTHEISHMRRGQMTAFRWVWNLVAGIPCLMPSFLYWDHKSHHVNHSYGTQDDGEYYPLAHGPFTVILQYFGQVFVLPIAAVVRFLVLTPLSFAIPGFRRVVWERFSALAVINPQYRRPPARGGDRIAALAQEWGCFVWLCVLAGMLAAGVIPWTWAGKAYLVFLIGASVNYARALGAHRYTSRGAAVSYVDQLLDSTTIEGRPIVTELMAPLGMRYHALHHLVPSLPYHSMGQAHRRLMQQLPPDSPYRQTVYPSLFSVIAEVCRGAWLGHPAPRTAHTTSGAT